MPRPFLRVDLSRNARDFRNVPVQSGVSLLDRASAHSKLLAQWLGRRVAEHTFDGEMVLFFVRNDDGTLPEVTNCRPATASELRGALRKELEGLQEALTAAAAQTPKEKDLQRIASSLLEQQVARIGVEDPSTAFYRYRDESGRTRLTWCWGYQPNSQEPAAASVCPDPECATLAMLAPGLPPKCLRCGRGLRAGKKRRKSGALFLATLILLLALGAAFFAARKYWPDFGKAPPEVAEKDAGNPETNAKLDADKPTAAVAGQVADDVTSAPIANARIKLAGASGESESDRKGGFRMEGVSLGEVQIDVEAAGYQPQHVVHELKDGEQAPLAIRLKGASHLLGQVVAAESQSPVATATITVTGTPYKAKTDQEGRFRIDNVRSGQTALEVAADGFEPQALSKDLEPGEGRLRVELKGGKIAAMPAPKAEAVTAVLSGQVVDASSGGPVPGAKVGLIGTDQSAVTDAEGRFRVEKLRLGPLELDIAATGYAGQKVSKELKAVEETIRVELKGSVVLAGQVVDAATSAPVAGAKVTPAGATQAVETDREGKFRLEGLGSGPLEIEVTAQGYASQKVSKDLKAAEETVRVELKGEAVLTGEVVDATSKAPIPAALVRTRSGGRAETGVDGRFRIAKLPPGPADIHVAAAGYGSQRLTAELSVAKEKPIRVELSKDAEAKPAVGLETKIRFFGIEAKGNSVGFVVDCSGSMEEGRLARTKAELEESVIGLDPKQLFYITFFSDRLLPMSDPPGAPVAASPLEKVRAFRWIQGIVSDGGTMPEPGLRMLADMKPNVIFLLSDGEFPEISAEALRLLKDNKIMVNTVAFEDPSGAQRLQEIAKATGGTYKFVPASAPPPQQDVMIATHLFQVLVAALHDPPPSDPQQIRSALRELCDRQDFGPEPGAAAGDVKRATDAWSNWWTDNRLIPAFQKLSRGELAGELSSGVAIRRLGALGAARRNNFLLPEEFIKALEDPDPAVRQAAHLALVASAGGEDYGPKPGASDLDRAKAVAQWRAWAERKKDAERMAADRQKQIASLNDADADVLRGHFQHADPAIRKAAMSAARRRRLPSWDEYIRAFEDADPGVRQEAGQSLAELSQGKADFTPAANAGDTEWKAAAQKWRDWRIQQQQKVADGKLRTAKMLYENLADKGRLMQDLPTVRKRFQEVIEQYPGTQAATEAQRHLDLPELKLPDAAKRK